MVVGIGLRVAAAVDTDNSLLKVDTGLRTDIPTTLHMET